MNLALRIANRYLRAKKSTNAINIITGISIFGLAIGTAALVLILSVFNGFRELIMSMESQFNPDVKVTATTGKTFELDSTQVLQLEQLEGITYISKTLEEVAYFQYRDNQDFGVIKGVDEYYAEVTGLDTTLREGKFQFQELNMDYVVVGGGMRNKLGIRLENQFAAVSVYMPKREKKRSLQQQVNSKFAYPSGVFSVQQEVDYEYILSSLSFAQNLMDAPNKLSALEIKLAENANVTQTTQQIASILGENFTIKDRYQQNEAFYKLMNVEKWMSFAIVSLTLILVVFNLIGALWMIVLEKRKDISILKSMGATATTIRNIFLNQGLLICLAGIGIGFAVALLLYFLQKQFGLVSIPAGFVVDSYPIKIIWTDFLAVAAVVLTIGLLASIPPAMKAKSISSMIRTI